jgi:hypothetical protein
MNSFESKLTRSEKKKEEITQEEGDAVRRWLRRHAVREICPPCANRDFAVRLWDSLSSAPCICPTCGKVWIYEAEIEKPVKNRKTKWHYSKIKMK